MRRLNIQKFNSTWDELEKTYTNNISNTQSQLDNLANEKQNLLNDYNDNYNNQLSEYENLMNQQQTNIDTWAEEQKKQQEAQKDYEIGLVEQNKKEAAEQTEAEIKDSYVDYMKQNNQYGGVLENLASAGLATQGYAESSKIAMYNTYQNRVGTAKSALLKANTQYDNQIQQALLNNDAKLAEIAYQQMQQSYQLALQGFEYRENLYNNKLAYEQNIGDTYFAREQELRDDINYYNSRLEDINNKQIAQEQWEREFAEAKRQTDLENQQFWANLYENQRQYNNEIELIYNDKNSDNGTPVAEDDYAYAKRVFGNSANTFNKDDYYFDNGYQPRYIENKKLNKTGVKVKEVFGESLGKNVAEQNIWHANGKYYIWIGSSKEYMELDKEYVNKMKKEAGIIDKILHKGVGWY